LVKIIDVVDDQMGADDREGIVPLDQLLQVVQLGILSLRA